MEASRNPVTVRVERMVIPTYPAYPPDPNPMFFENRNIQGAKGNIYPHPYIDRLSGEKVEREYTAVVLENEYLQLVMLPEIGGRIFAGLDKTNGYDFFYRHRVIKPALIGLFGPWISGGVEFNWPQHHRPTTFDPTHFAIEEHPDGAITVWMGEHEPLQRTKGMVGICLHPGKAFVETKARLYNRTPIPQTFLWWANAGVHINEHYQVIFPPDVHYAVYHVKNPVTSYPIARGEFNGWDYGEGTDVSYWANSPVATSFFAGPSRYAFFGGYDHDRRAGVVHVADPGISPGKKFFTWGNGDFGHQWQRNLMDDTGEYLELMAGVYTDNQPDFSWIMPYETKTFSQFWFPVQEIGGMKNANLHGALNLETLEGMASVGVYTVEALDGARVRLTAGTQTLLDEAISPGPGRPFTTRVALPEGIVEQDLCLSLLAPTGEVLIQYRPEPPWDGTMAEPYKPPLSPQETVEIEQLYLSGLHLEQYRHPTLSPEAYWEEALRRDPGESRCHMALGRSFLRRGLFAEAEAHFRKAVERLTSWNNNPYDGEAHYGLGLALFYQQRTEEARLAFAKASWNAGWKAPASLALAQLDLLVGNLTATLEHLRQAHSVNAECLKTRNLMAAALRRKGELEASGTLAAETAALDRLDAGSRFELLLIAQEQANASLADRRLKEFRAITGDDVQLYLDIAFDYASAGLIPEATSLLELAAEISPLHPMVAYTLGWLAEKQGRSEQAGEWYARGAEASPLYCFPWRLEEIGVLKTALQANPQDSRAHYYLGNLLYDKRRHAEATAHWKEASRGEPGFSISWRNLGLAAYNLEKDLDTALEYYQKALEAAPQDPRLLMEFDGLLRRKAVDPAERLALLESRREVVEQRDDLVVSLMSLYNRLGQPEKTLEITTRRTFHAWEGGEGSVSGQYTDAHWLIGRRALEAGDALTALHHLEEATRFPANLGEHPWDGIIAHAVYYRGLALQALNREDEARAAFEWLIDPRRRLEHFSPYFGLALVQLGRPEEGRAALKVLKRRAEKAAEEPFRWNYFYSGHPSPVFDDDQQKIHRLNHTLTAGLAAAALKDRPGAKSALGLVLALDPANLFAWEEYRRL